MPTVTEGFYEVVLPSFLQQTERFVQARAGPFWIRLVKHRKRDGWCQRLFFGRTRRAFVGDITVRGKNVKWDVFGRNNLDEAKEIAILIECEFKTPVTITLVSEDEWWPD